MEVESQQDQDQEQGETKEDFKEQLNIKIEKYFESKQYLESRDELNNFLSEIDLLEVWDSDEEKDTLWQFIFKYNKNSKIDCEGAKKALNKFLFLDEDEDADQKDEDPEDLENLKKERKESKDNILTRISRLSRISNLGVKEKSNKLALNRYKQRAIDEYDCLDITSLIQFKRIFALLKITKSNGKINFDDLKEICANNKFITCDVNDIWKYLSYCVCEENLKNLEDKKELEINNEIMEEVKDFITQKLINEDVDFDSDNLEEAEVEDKKDNLEEMSLNLIEKIIKQVLDINENNLVLNEIKREIKDVNAKEIDNGKELINQKIEQIDEFIKKSQKETNSNINKLESLKENILKITDNIKVMKEDFNALYIKFKNNQQDDMDEQTERLVDENIMLNQIKENKEAEIENLLEEKKTMKKEYQNILMQYEDAIREKNELTQEISELKMSNYKLKGDYDNLLNDLVNKIDKDKKNKKNSKNAKNGSYEDQIKEIKSINNAKIDDGEKISRKKDIFKNMTNEKLINYIMEIERINQALSNEKNSRDKKIHELTQKNLDLNNLMKVVKDRNVDLEEEAKNLQKKIDNLNMDVQNNEMFRPSIAMNSQMRVSRLSKLNMQGINAQKFSAVKGGNFSGKKKIEKFKLKDKDKNISQNVEKKSSMNKFENISMDLYGVKEVDDEEEDQENKKHENINKNLQEFNINQSELNLENKKDNNLGITSNRGLGIEGSENKNAQFGIGGNTGLDFGNKNDYNNSVTAFNINNINSNNKGNLESISSGGILFDGMNNDINLSHPSDSNINFDQGGEIEIQNINDINLSSGNNINFYDNSSSVINFDIKNSKNIINNNNDKKQIIICL